MTKFNQQGALPVLVLVVVLGLLAFFILSSIGAFKTHLFSAIFPKPASFAAGNMTIDGSQKFQIMDGFGTNAIPKSWNNGALKPAIDWLVDGGNTLWRVDIGNGHSDWEATNDDADPFNFNWTYYNTIYTNSKFQDLWSELAYLNAKGITGIELSASGWSPAWLQSSNGTIAQTKEDEFVESITSAVYYARFTKGIQFKYLSPMNETDKSSLTPEGQLIGAAQMARIMAKFATRLDQLGMGDVQLIGPHTSNFEQTYTQALLGNATAMGKMKAFSYHSYGTTADAPSFADFSLSTIRASSHPDTKVWVGEWNQCFTDGCLDGSSQVSNEWNFAKEMTAELLNHIEEGASAVQSWDAWDNWHEHNTCCAINRWGQIALNADGVTYSPKKRLYSNGVIFKFIIAGMTRISASSGNSSIRILAFSDPASGKVTLVGRNKSSSAQTVSGLMTNVPNVTSLALYQTTSTKNIERAADVPVSGGSFSMTVDPDSFFALSTEATGPGPSVTPTPSPSPLPSPSPSKTPSPSPSPSPLPSPSPSRSPSPSPVVSPSPVPSAKPGDIDGNNKVDIFDYNILLTNFSKSGTGIQGDLDGNNKVDIFDYNILLTNFGH